MNNASLIEPARFHDRREAGKLLAERLRHLDRRKDVVVLGIPRGGIPVAREVAEARRLLMDVLVVQRIDMPLHDAWQQQPVAGAVAMGGVRILNEARLAALHLPPEDVDLAIRTAEGELARRESAYRDGCPFPDVRGRTVLIVDDGIATGVTLRAAIAAVRPFEPSRIIVATPVGCRQVCQEIEKLADEVVCLLSLPECAPIYHYYDDFPKVSEEDVRVLVEAGRLQWRAPSPCTPHEPRESSAA